MRIGLQLYTLREAMEQDYVGTLEKVAAMGYEGIEFAGYGGLTPSEMKATLSRLGLEVAGSHVGIEDLLDDVDKHIEMNQAVGNDRLICNFLPREYISSREQVAETVEKFRDIAERLMKNNMKFGYHNHDFEFTTIYNGVTVQELLFEGLPADQLFSELDVCWVKFSGNDPVEWVNSYAGRLPIVHMKDLGRTEDGKPLTLELGQGEVDLCAVAHAAKLAGAEWLVIEQDVTQRDPLVSVEASLQWMKSNVKL